MFTSKCLVLAVHSDAACSDQALLTFGLAVSNRACVALLCPLDSGLLSLSCTSGIMYKLDFVGWGMQEVLVLLCSRDLPTNQSQQCRAVHAACSTPVVSTMSYPVSLKALTVIIFAYTTCMATHAYLAHYAIISTTGIIGSSVFQDIKCVRRSSRTAVSSRTRGP